MKINYIISDTIKSATSKTLSQVVLRAEKDFTTNFVVVVPETKSIIIEKELLSLSKNGAFANIFIYSFVRLLGRLDFVQKDKIISKQTAVMLIRKIIYDNYDNLKCYKKTAKTISFAEKIYDTLQQFKSSEISVDDLKLVVLNCDSALKSKLEDILFLYEEYEKLLGDSLFDDCDKLNLITKFAKTSDFIKNSEIFVVGFDNVTSEMISVLEELAKNSKEITFSSVYFSDKRQDKYIQNNDLFLKFRRVAENLKYPYIPTLVASHKKGDFYAVANNLFLPQIKKQKYNGNIKVFAAQNKEQEIRFVASKIIELVNSGARFKDIGVMSLDLSSEGKLIRRIFDEYNINYFINEEYDISNHYFISFIKLCFELYLSHLSSDKVLKFLKSKFIDEPLINEFENFVYEYGLNYNDFLKPLSDDLKQNCKNFDVYIDILSKFQSFYIKFAEILKKSNTANDFIDSIYFIFENLNVKKILDDNSEFFIQNNKQEDAQISVAIYNKVEEFLKSLRNFLGQMQMSADEFLQIFMSGFGAVRLNLSPVSIDCVVVQNNTDGFFNIKNMFIIGADEDKFPMVISDSGIILDEELEKTNLLSGKKVEPTTKEINAREKFAAYEALLEPTEGLFVSYSKLGLDGSQKKPSSIINRLIKLFGENVLLVGFNEQKFITKNRVKNDFASDICDFFSNKINEESINEKYNILLNDLSEPFKRYLEFLAKENNDFKIDDAKNLYFSNDKVSASQFEKYFMCPYMFFASYGLRLKENKNAKLSKLDIGVVLHKVCELFVKNIYIYINLKDDDIDKKIIEFVDNVFESLNIKKSRNKAAIKFIYEESKRLCKFLLNEQKQSDFKAKYNEFAFFDKNSPILNLKDNECLKLEGKIDRVDEFGDFVRIIDYKTGGVDADLYSIYYGKKIQLISYLSAITQIKDKKVAGLFYLPIHSDYAKNIDNLNQKYKMNGFLLKDIEVVKHMDNKLSFNNPKSNLVPIEIKTSKEHQNRNEFELGRMGQKFLSEKEFENLKIYNEKLCEEAALEIREGFIEPSPLIKNADENSLPCNWCEFAGFCGLERAKFANGRRCESGVEIKSFNEEKEN